MENRVKILKVGVRVMKTKQNIIDVAKYIIKYANDNDHHLSVFKLENLLYYINIYSLI